MKSTTELLNKTVLDLCEETYSDKYGYKAYDLLKTPSGPRAAIIVCVNSLLDDNKHTYDLLVEDYEIFSTCDFNSTMKIQTIFDMSTLRGLPVAAKVTDYEQKCFIIASCQQPWVDWLASSFCKDGNIHDLIRLEPLIKKELERFDITQQRGRNMVAIINVGILNGLFYDSRNDAICGAVVFNKNSIGKLLALISTHSMGYENWSEINEITTRLFKLIRDDMKVEISPLAAKGSRLEIPLQPGKEYDFTYHG